MMHEIFTINLLDTYRTFCLDYIFYYFPPRFSYLFISNPFYFPLGLVFNLEVASFSKLPSPHELTLPFPHLSRFSDVLFKELPYIFRISRRILLLIGILANYSLHYLNTFRHCRDTIIIMSVFKAYILVKASNRLNKGKLK